MKRVLLLSLFAVAGIGALAGAKAIGLCPSMVSAAGSSSCSDGSSACSAPAAATHAAATTKGSRGHKDAFMAMVCERSCAAKTPYREAMVVAQPRARVGDLTRCPVSGVVFTVTAQHPDILYRGGHYRLCCAGCEKKFRAHPARFIS